MTAPVRYPMDEYTARRWSWPVDDESRHEGVLSKVPRGCLTWNLWTPSLCARGELNPHVLADTRT